MRNAHLFVAYIVLAQVAASVIAQDEPSVQVQLAPLEKGSLPQIVTAYGAVEPSASAQRTIMAPAAAIVGEVYVRAGQEVDKDTPLVRLSPSPPTESAYAQAQTAMRVATDLVDRTRKMVEQRLATNQQLADAQKSEADARAALAALQAQGAGGANVLRAPFSGVVTAISTNPGAIVAEGTSLLTLAARDGLILKVGVIPSQAGAIKVDDPVSVTPLGGSSKITARVVLRGAMVDSTTGMIPVEIALPSGNFLPGEAATAAITTGQSEGYLVPHDAVLVDDRGNSYVVQAVDMTAKQVPVRVLDTQGDRDVIEGSLDASASVVLTGNHQLQDGMKVRLATPSDKAAP